MEAMEQTEAMDGARLLAQDINERHAKKLDKEGQPRAWASNRASGLGDPCMRRVVLWRTEGQRAKPWSREATARMQRGKMLEGPVLRMVEDLGIELEQGQVSLGHNPYEIGTRLDSVAVYERRRYVVEFWTIAPWLYDRLWTARDFVTGSKWAQKKYDQLQPYILLGSLDDRARLEEAGIMLIYDALGGRLRAVPIPLDLQRAEHLLDRAEQINRHMRDGTLPDVIEDSAECLSCPLYKQACFPQLSFAAATIFGDDVRDAIATAEETAEAALANSRVRRFLRPLLKGVRFGLAGPYVIRGKKRTDGKWQARWFETGKTDQEGSDDAVD